MNPQSDHPNKREPEPGSDGVSPRKLPVLGAAPECVPARMINEVLYCERIVYLEWAQGEFEDNAYTVEGRAVHRRADQPGGKLPPKSVVQVTQSPSDELDDDEERTGAKIEERPYTARSVWLSSERLRLTAKIDVVEGDPSGRVIPIEYKRGMAPEVPFGARLPERAQVCAQALLLREHGYRVDTGEIYYAGSRKRVEVKLDGALIEATLSAIDRALEVVSSGRIPDPLIDDPRCDGCSLSGICLPDETNLLKRLGGAPPPPPETMVETEGVAEETVGLETSDEDFYESTDPDSWGPSVGVPTIEMRRLQPARDDRVPLYVQEQGARIGIEGEELKVTSREGVVKARLANTSQVCVMGNVQVTTQALRELLERSIPVAYFSRSGWFYGRLTGLEPKNIELRIAQYRAAIDKTVCLGLARQFVVSKVRNSRTLLRRNHQAPDPVVLGELEQLAKKVGEAPELASLLGLEGTAARIYFSAFSGMLRGGAAQGGFDWEGRSRRPPADPINALLSFSYALLTKELTVALTLTGLDPMLGFYHQPRFGRAALALDLMEEFRPLLCDSAVIGALNNGVVRTGDFVCAAGSAALNPAGRKKFLLAWERRLDQLVTHPVFGYRISYRRVLEVQSRLLGRFLLGEIEEYPSFRTR